jgi:hypothetical protein
VALQDELYFHHNFPKGCGFSTEQVQGLIDVGKDAIAEFYADLKVRPLCTCVGLHFFLSVG